MSKLPFKTLPGEKVLFKDWVIWLKTIFTPAFNIGLLFLTNKRIILVKKNFVLAIAILIAAKQSIELLLPNLEAPLKYLPFFVPVLLASIALHFPRKELFNLSLKEITQVLPTQYGLNKKTILFHTASKGEIKLTIQSSPEEWVKKIKEAQGK